MILQSLVQCYEALERKGKVTKQGWCQAKVSYALEIDENGELLSVISLKREEVKGKKVIQVPQILEVPEMLGRSSGVNANFLCDNSSYILGIDKKGKPSRTEECFLCAKEKHIEILEKVNSKAAKAVVAYFEKWDSKKTEENLVLKPYLQEIMDNANLIFYYRGMYVQEDPDVRLAWEEYMNQQKEGEKGICLVTGQKTQICRTHGTIRGIQGAQSSGAALVSFNAPAFESYGKEQSFNAPTGSYAVYAYTTALNYLVNHPEYCKKLGDTTIVYWEEDDQEEYLHTFWMSMNPEKDTQDILNQIFKKLQSNQTVDVNQLISLDKKFCILGISPNAARLSVRFFWKDTFGNILKNIKKYYDEIEIIRPVSDQYQYFGIWRILQETVNQKSRDKMPHPNLPGMLLQSILSGQKYPAVLYYSVLGRIRAEQDDKDNHIYKITRGRAAIIKAYLLRNSNNIKLKEGISVELNEENNQIAYVLGREFAVLEAIQKRANPEINATIKDRYFNSACATPAIIFPILFKLKNSHMKKIEYKNQIYYEKMLTDLQAKIQVPDGQANVYPARLGLEEQGMFILGYYHQTQKFYEKKEKGELNNVRNN